MVWIQVRFGEWRAAIRHPGAFFKIQFVQWTATAKPCNGTSAKLAYFCKLHGGMFPAIIFSLIQRLCFLIEFHAPTFQKYHLELRIDKLPGERNSCCTGPDN